MSSLDIVPREESERRLAAILVADVVSYSRLMQADEEGTLSKLEEIGASIIDPRVAAHRGHIFRTMGDGLLIEFPSVGKPCFALLKFRKSCGCAMQTRRSNGSNFASASILATSSARVTTYSVPG